MSPSGGLHPVMASAPLGMGAAGIFAIHSRTSQGRQTTFSHSPLQMSLDGPMFVLCSHEAGDSSELSLPLGKSCHLVQPGRSCPEPKGAWCALPERVLPQPCILSLIYTHMPWSAPIKPDICISLGLGLLSQETKVALSLPGGSTS